MSKNHPIFKYHMCKSYNTDLSQVTPTFVQKIYKNASHASQGINKTENYVNVCIHKL